MKKLLLMIFLVGLLASCGGVELTPLEKKQEIAKKAIFEGNKEAKEELDKILQELKENHIIKKLIQKIMKLLFQI